MERVYPTSDVQEEVGTAGIDLRTHCAIEFMKALIQVNARKDPKAAFELADSFLEVRDETN